MVVCVCRFLNKEFNIVRLQVYFNSMSQMTIPTSLWRATKHDPLQIFSALDAVTVLEMMNWCFDPERAMEISQHNLIEPLYINVAINLNSEFQAQYVHHTYKYRVVVLVSKVIVTLTPDALKDVF